MSVSIVIAACCLVLIGLLFGFNIQIDNSIISLFTSISSVVAALAAAAAAYFSYESIGQWRKQTEHSLLHQNFNELESLLISFVDKFQDMAFDDTLRTPTKVLGIAGSSARHIRQDYDKTYRKIRELISVDKRDELASIELSTITVLLHAPLLELKSALNRVDKFCKDNPETETKSVDDFPELQDEMIKVWKYTTKIHQICSQSIETLRDLRASI